MQSDTGNDQDELQVLCLLPLHNVPPAPAPPLHPLPSLSSCHSPQTATLAAKGSRVMGRQGRSKSAERAVE
jgi:hypothetical protein